jgi:hypothetical protein
MERRNTPLALLKRCSYERTNPERLPSSELAKADAPCLLAEMVAPFDAHPEFLRGVRGELLGGRRVVSKVHQAVGCVAARARRADLTVRLLKAARFRNHTDGPADCLPARHGKVSIGVTLGFILYQQMVRRQNRRRSSCSLPRLALSTADPEKVQVNREQRVPTQRLVRDEE